MNILFFGTDYYSTLALIPLLKQSEHKVVGVITNPKKPSMPFKYISVYEIAKEHAFPLILVDSKASLVGQAEKIRSIKADIGLVASFGYLIPQSIFTLPKHGTLNIHPSLLPDYRGVSPIQQAIFDGKETTGVTVMKINESFDTGSILAQSSINIDRTDTTHTLAMRLFPLGSNLFLDIISKYSDGVFAETQQGESQTDYTKVFTKEIAYINFTEGIATIDRKIRAFYPKPLAWTYLPDLVKFYNPYKAIPDRWIQKRVLLHSSNIQDNSLHINLLQIEGKAPISWEQFSQGYL